MLKAKATDAEGKELIIFGLTDKNLEKLKAGQPILIDLTEMGLEVQGKVLIFHGATERAMVKTLEDLNFIDANTPIKNLVGSKNSQGGNRA